MDLTLAIGINSIDQETGILHLSLKSDISAADVKDVTIYIAVVENNLSSDV